MKTLIVSLIAFILLVTTWFFAIDYLNDSIKDLIAMDNQVNTYIAEKDWEAAQETFEEFMALWKKHESIFHIFLDQENVMEVNYAISQAKVFIAHKETSASLGHLSFIKEQLNFLHQNELVTLENIF